MMETRKVNLCMFIVLPPPPLFNMFSVCLLLGLSGANRDQRPLPEQTEELEGLAGVRAEFGQKGIQKN